MVFQVQEEVEEGDEEEPPFDEEEEAGNIAKPEGAHTEL